MEIQKLNLSVSKDSKNPFFKSSYVSLDNLVSTLTPFLNERGLLLYHYTKDKSVYTVVADTESGEVIESAFPMIESNDPQKLGSCISYAKRYNISQLFNIITDRDDDGNSASGKGEDKKEVKETAEAVCVSCSAKVSSAVAKFSEDKFGNILCMDCQKK